jgi:hypothetical protein
LDEFFELALRPPRRSLLRIEIDNTFDMSDFTDLADYLDRHEEEVLEPQLCLTLQKSTPEI